MSEIIEVKKPYHKRKWGWGWNATCEQTETGLYVPPPTRPDHTGTLKQVQDAINNDGTYHSLRSGGTILNVQWFYDGRPICNEEFREAYRDLQGDRQWAEMQGDPTPTTSMIIHFEEEETE